MIIIWIHLLDSLLKNPRGEAPYRADAHVLLFRLKHAAKGSSLFRRVLMQQIVRHLDRVDSARPDKFVNSGVIVLGCEPDEPHKPLVAQSPQFRKQPAFTENR